MPQKWPKNDSKMTQKWRKNDAKMTQKWRKNDAKMTSNWLQNDLKLTRKPRFGRDIWRLHKSDHYHWNETPIKSRTPATLINGSSSVEAGRAPSQCYGLRNRVNDIDFNWNIARDLMGAACDWRQATTTATSAPFFFPNDNNSSSNNNNNNNR